MNEIQLFEDKEKVELVKNTVCKDASDDELSLFLYTCKRTGLDPFAKQIYSIPRTDKKTGKTTRTIQTSIDGFRLIADRTGKYSPGKEPSYTYDDKGKIFSCTAYIKKMSNDGTWHEVASTAYWKEYVVTYYDKPSSFWEKMPHLMLAKCAEALALRKAFPADLSGLYTDDEMGQANNKTKKEDHKEIEQQDTIEIDEEPPEKEALSDDEINDLVALLSDELRDKIVHPELLKDYLFEKRAILLPSSVEANFKSIKGNRHFLPKYTLWLEQKK